MRVDRRGEREVTYGFRRGPKGERMGMARLDPLAMMDLETGGAVILMVPLNETATEQLLLLVCSPLMSEEDMTAAAKALEGWKPRIPLRRK